MVDALEGASAELDHVDLDPVATEVIEERAQQALRPVGVSERAVDQVHAEHAERFLLHESVAVEHPRVQDDLVRLGLRVVLEADPHPTVTVGVAAVVLGRHRVREREERALASPLEIEPFDQQVVFVVEHRDEATARDVALGRAVDRVADVLVVGRHGLRDRPGRAADAKEPAPDLLAGTDLGEAAVDPRIEVELERLRSRCHRLGHGRSPFGRIRQSVPRPKSDSQTRRARPMWAAPVATRYRRAPHP